MKTVFKSRIGAVVVIPIILALGLPLLTLPFTWTNMVVIGVLAMILLPIVFATYYTIEDNMLLIRCGFLYWNIEIKSIVSIKETMNVLSSPALSFDRLEIRYENGSSRIFVSPKLKQDFINTLKSLNEKISVSKRR